MANVPSLPFNGAALHSVLAQLASETATIPSGPPTINWGDIQGRPAIPEVRSFATDAEAQSYSTANPSAIVFSRESA